VTAPVPASALPKEALALLPAMPFLSPLGVLRRHDPGAYYHPTECSQYGAPARRFAVTRDTSHEVIEQIRVHDSSSQTPVSAMIGRFTRL